MRFWGGLGGQRQENHSAATTLPTVGETAELRASQSPLDGEGCHSRRDWAAAARPAMCAAHVKMPCLHCSRCFSDNLHDVGSGGDVGEVPVLSLQLLGQPGGGNESGYHPSKQNLHRTLGLALFRPRALRTLESESSSSHRCTSSLQPFSLQMDSSI